VPQLAGIVGSVVLPVLGAVPDGAIVLFSGLGPADEVKEQIAVGVGALAGSTIMLLTIPWALCIYQGRVDIVTGTANYKSKNKLSVENRTDFKKALMNSGISPRHSININGKIMLSTALSYVIIQLAAFGSSCGTDSQCHEDREHWVALVSLLTSVGFFVGYLVYNVKFADEEDKEDKLTEVKKKAIESHILSISAAFESHFQTESVAAGVGEQKQEGEEKRFHEALSSFFRKYDKNKDGVIDAFELRALLKDLNEDMPEDKFQAFLKEIDTDGSGTISFKEFCVAMKGFIASKSRKGSVVNDGSIALSSISSAASSGADDEGGAGGDNSNGKQLPDDEGEEDEDQEEFPEDLASLPPNKRTLRILLRSGWMMGIGTVVVLLFSDPMVDVLSSLGNLLTIPPFYVAFVLAPVASNASELIASIAYAKKKSQKTITISLAALEGAACMNNTFCLFIFLCLIFSQNLAWEFSAETISILFIEVCLFFVTLMPTTRLYHALIILSLYPFSIFLVWLLENVAGLN